MLIQLIDYALLVWFALAGMSAAYVAYDQWHNNPEPNVMRAGFVLVTLYMGPLGGLLYVLAMLPQRFYKLLVSNPDRVLCRRRQHDPLRRG